MNHRLSEDAAGYFCPVCGVDSESDAFQYNPCEPLAQLDIVDVASAASVLLSQYDVPDLMDKGKRLHAWVREAPRRARAQHQQPLVRGGL